MFFCFFCKKVKSNLFFYQQRFKNSLTHLLVLWNRLMWCCPWGVELICHFRRHEFPVYRSDYWGELSKDGDVRPKKKQHSLIYWCFVEFLVWMDWVDDWGLSNSGINVKATRYFYFSSKMKAHRLAFKRSSGLPMQTNRPQQETQHSLVPSTLIIVIYSPLLTNPWKFHSLKLRPKRLQETTKGCILFFNLRCLRAFEATHIK